MKGFHLERSRHDIKHFYEWLGYGWGDHISEWMKLYSERGDESIRRVCIIAPRSHSKSTTLRVKLIHQCLFDKWKNKPVTVWLFSASIPAAKRRLEEIKEDMRNHPDLRKMLNESRTKKDELHFNNGSWIKATGVGSAIRGEHPAVVALDDVLADLGDTSMDTITDWFRKVITPMLDPDSSLYVVGTPMSLTDLYHTEMLSEAAQEVWKSGVWSAIPNWDEHRADPSIQLKALWPDFRPIAFLLEQKLSMNDELAFTQEYLCKVVDDDSQVFKRGVIRKNINVGVCLGLKKEFDDQKYVIGFDPAHGIGKDYSVMIVLRQDAQGIIHFVNMWRRNDFPPDQQANTIIEWCKLYGKPTLAAEDVGFQRLYEALLQQKGAVIDFVGSKASNKGLKQGLLNRLRTWFEQEKFEWPYGDIKTREVVKIILNELDNHVWKGGEIVDVGKHNDCVMALAHAIDQFNDITAPPAPVVTGTTTMQSWKGNSKPRNPPPSGSKYVGLF